MKIIGTKFCGHDSALCLLDFNTKKIFAISTERVTRIKHDQLDISPILENYKFSNIDYVAHSYSDFEDKAQDGELREKMLYNKDIEKALRQILKPNYIKDLNISRYKKNIAILGSYFSNFNAVKDYYSAKFKRAIVKETAEGNKRAYTDYINLTFAKLNLFPKKILFFEHHLCHAIPSYYLSPFNGKNAIALTIDGQGDGYFSKAYFFEGVKNFKLIGQSSADYIGGGDRFLSIGRIYNLFTQAMDLRPNSDEGKVEALAAYGIADEELLLLLKSATHINKESLCLGFDIDKIECFYNLEWLKNQRKKIGDENFCASVQTFLEELVVEYLGAIYKKFPTKNLCLSGGVAANIIMSLKIYENTSFENIYVLPPMGDEGLAIGSAILTAIELKKDVSWLRDLRMPYFGDSYSRKQVESVFAEFNNLIYEDVNENWPEEAAKSVAMGKICALFHGRMEFGPRALGNRSIVANPAFENIRQRINSTVKRRPNYQPFCPSILEEERNKLFERSFAHKHMAIAFRMKEKYISELPCAVHVDGTARPQFVEKKDNPMYHRYLSELKNITGYGVSLNTSFNLHGRTIVRTPRDAIIDFIDCNIDELYIEGFKVKLK